jgi:6-phosphogluconate dehydrogenase (decarboxylating)
MACIMHYSRLLITGVGITMQMGIIRPERMGKNMGRRGMQAGQDCVIFDLDADFVRALQMEAAAVGRCLVHGRLVSEARSTTL